MVLPSSASASSYEATSLPHPPHSAPGLDAPRPLLERYNIAGPRYTSYPTAPTWGEQFDGPSYEQMLDLRRERALLDPHYAQKPISLYVHLPFCEARCLFCSCNVIITQQREHAETYLTHLFKEIDLVASRLGDSPRTVGQLHWGGGTPTYLSLDQIERLFRYITDRFPLAPDAEVALEVDPRVTTPEQMRLLRSLGFNRVSMGVQDVAPEVQEAVRRIQPLEQTTNLVQLARELDFYHGVNIDLIYGLPHQTEARFHETVESVIHILQPDRLALYNFAHVPWMSPHQKKLPTEALPSGPTKFNLFKNALLAFTQQGYDYIGMDHFAKKTDPLAVALREGRLHRNFMGYTVRPGAEAPEDILSFEDELFDMLSFGVSSIGSGTTYYVQNVKKLSTYYNSVSADALPVHRGYRLSDEDQLRRFVIQRILCQGTLSLDQVDRLFAVDSAQHFHKALNWLQESPTQDGLITWHDAGRTFSLTPLGRIFSRNIAMPFDAYLKQQQSAALRDYGRSVFSRTL